MGLNLMWLNDVVDIQGRGLVLVVSFIESDKQHSAILKKLVGSKIVVSNVDGSDFEFVVKDISVSFSISNSLILGINIQERVDAEKIKKGSVIQLSEDQPGA